MRPIELRLQAFGSFAGTEVIDFDALAARGLFVVSGDTGTGKTTIFDAMCWALYGEMPRKDAGEVRSHHVVGDLPTEVVFTFESDGDRYVVRRAPAQERSAKRGSGRVTEKVNAELLRVTADGTEVLATKWADATHVCTEIIGLESRQFERVILLPQGEFARFLLADSKERETLLSRLFGGTIYDRIVDELKQARAAARDQVGDTDRDIVEQLNGARTNLARATEALGGTPPDDLDDADRSRVGELLDVLAAPLAQLTDEVRRLEDEAVAAANRHQQATDAARRFDDATAHRAALATLDADQPVIQDGWHAAEQSAAARPVVVAADDLAVKQAAASESAREHDRRSEAIRSAFESIGVDIDVASVVGVTAVLAEQRQQLDGDRGAVTAVQDATAAVDEALSRQRQAAEQIDAVTATRAAALGRIDEIDSRLPDIERAAVDPATIDEEISSVATLIGQRRRLDEVTESCARASSVARRAVERYDEVLAAFVATEAPRLAANLHAGEPCPVCGSTDHPAPADSDVAEAAAFADVERAGADRDRANTALRDQEVLLIELRNGLAEHVDASIDELVERRDSLAERRSVAVAAVDELHRLTEERVQCSKQVTDAAAELAALEERRSAAEIDVRRRSAELSEVQSAAAHIDLAAIDRRAAVLDRIDGFCDGLEACFTRSASDAGLVTAAERALADAMATSPFDSVDAASMVVLSPDEEERRRRAKRDHDEQRVRERSALDTLEGQGIPDERPDVALAEAAATAARDAHQRRLASQQTASDATRYVIEALERHDEVLERSAVVRRRAELLERTYTVCSQGGPGVEMSLKRWVLSRELDRVTAAANVHLQHMTGQRYSLRRRGERTDGRRAFGLDLEVFDAQTGRPRSTSSLSGGEQFQASLALALGLADVVSHGGVSSGKRFEALFVDEGFGSLSSEALDDAIETLHQLHATGRMVGAITHVEAMKQQLHVGIEVRRRDDGVGSTLQVHP